MITFTFSIDPETTDIDPLLAGGWLARLFIRRYATTEAIERGYLADNATELPYGSDIGQSRENADDPTDWRIYFTVTMPDEAERFSALLRASGFTGNEI